MLAQPERFAGKRVGLVLCGGNIDPRTLASMTIRGMERENRVVSFRVIIADRPGPLGRIATTLGRHGGNILEVDHRGMFLDEAAKGARLDITVETRTRPTPTTPSRRSRPKALLRCGRSRRRDDGIARYSAPCRP